MNNVHIELLNETSFYTAVNAVQKSIEAGEEFAITTNHWVYKHINAFAFFYAASTMGYYSDVAFLEKYLYQLPHNRKNKMYQAFYKDFLNCATILHIKEKTFSPHVMQCLIDKDAGQNYKILNDDKTIFHQTAKNDNRRFRSFYNNDEAEKNCYLNILMPLLLLPNATELFSIKDPYGCTAGDLALFAENQIFIEAAAEHLDITKIYSDKNLDRYKIKNSDIKHLASSIFEQKMLSNAIKTNSMVKKFKL